MCRLRWNHDGALAAVCGSGRVETKLSSAASDFLMTLTASPGLPSPRAPASILTVRPRVCELAELGFVECIGREGREGVYQAVTLAARQARHEEDLREESQLPLQLS